MNNEKKIIFLHIYQLNYLNPFHFIQVVFMTETPQLLYLILLYNRTKLI